MRSAIWFQSKLMFTRIILTAVLLGSSAGTIAGQEAPATIQQLTGTWKGTVGASRTTTISFTFSKDSTSMRGTFAARGSGVLAGPVQVSSDTGATLRLALPNGWQFRARIVGAQMSGTLAANG